jgi:hypothetical protein
VLVAVNAGVAEMNLGLVAAALRIRGMPAIENMAPLVPMPHTSSEVIEPPLPDASDPLPPAPQSEIPRPRPAPTSPRTPTPLPAPPPVIVRLDSEPSAPTEPGAATNVYRAVRAPSPTAAPLAPPPILPVVYTDSPERRRAAAVATVMVVAAVAYVVWYFFARH